MPDKETAWVLYNPRNSNSLLLSPLVAEQIASQKLLWIADVIAQEVHEPGPIERPRPVSFQSPQLWTTEAHQPDQLDSYGHLAAYYYHGQNHPAGPMLYSEGVFLFHDPECHPEDGYPQVSWVVYRGEDGAQWRVVQADEYPGGGNGAT